MTGYLAALCFLASLAVICLKINGVNVTAYQSLTKSIARDDSGTARSKTVLGTKRVTVVTEQQRQNAKDALWKAAAIQPEKDQKVIWSEENFQRDLSKLTREDARNFVVELLSRNESGVPVMKESARSGWWSESESNHFKLISGFIALLAKENFLNTVSWLDTLPVLEKNMLLARVVYNEALLAGAEQDPYEAWRVYQEKCPPWFG